MSELIGDLVVRIGGDTASLQSAMQRAKTAVGDFASSSRDAATNVATVGVAAGVAAAAGIAALVAKTMDAVGAQADLAARLGTTSASIANLSHAAMLSGVEMGKVEASSEFLARKLSEASDSGSSAADTFARLGLSASALQNMPLDQRISAINQALTDNVSASDRAAVAAEIYGSKAGSAMRQLTPEALASAADEVKRLGLNISEIDAEKIAAAGDAVDRVSKVFDGMLQQMTAELAPVITAVANQFFDAATGAEGFGTAGKSAGDAIVTGVGVAMDVVEGVRRSFELAGKGIVVMALEGDKAMNELAQAIVAGPVDAINRMLNAVNSMTGADFELIDISGLQANIDNADAVLAQAYADMHETMMQPMPSGQFQQFVEEARAAATEAAAADVAMKAALRGDGSGTDSGDPKSNKKEADDKQAKNSDLMERVNAVREANATQLELVAQKEAQELATLQAARDANLMSEQAYQAALAETKKRFGADRLNGIREANTSELELMRQKQAAELAELVATREQGLIGDAEFQALKAQTEERFRQERLGGIMTANATELQLAQEKHALELETLRTTLADKLMTEQEYEAARAEMLKRHGEEATAIKQQEEEAKTRVQKEQEAARRAALGTALGDLSTLMNSGSRKMFEVGKAAAISQTVLSTYEGAQKAYSSLAGIPVVGPGLGIAAAGAAIAAGVARVQSIRSQTFGGGASTPTGSNTGQINAGSQPVAASGGGGSAAPGQTMYIQGLNKNDLYSGSQLVDLINHAQENGARLRIL